MWAGIIALIPVVLLLLKYFLDKDRIKRANDIEAAKVEAERQKKQDNAAQVEHTKPSQPGAGWDAADGDPALPPISEKPASAPLPNQ